MQKNGKIQTKDWDDAWPLGIQWQRWSHIFFDDENQVWNAAGKYFIVEHSIKVVAKEDKCSKLRALKGFNAEKIICKINVSNFNNS